MLILIEINLNDYLWCQLIDDVNSWEETSCTAMFGYEMALGVKKGYLNSNKYKKSIFKAWTGLSEYINPDGTVRQVCMGTGQDIEKIYYLNRPQIIGDYHGQAPVLWFANSLLKGLE